MLNGQVYASFLQADWFIGLTGFIWIGQVLKLFVGQAYELAQVYYVSGLISFRQVRLMQVYADAGLC